MSISKKNKLVVILVALLSLSVLFGSVNLFKGNADQTAYTVEQVTDAESGTFKMAGGAYIRNNDQDAVTSGLKYALTLSEDQYNGLKQSVANGVYESVEFGVFILPKAYNDVYAVRDYAFASDANENSPKYNWAIKNDEGEWVYTPETGKARIFNLTGDAMVYDEQLGVMAFYGVITNVLPENMGKEMLAVGYLAYTVNGETNYLFTAQKDEINNVRTMAYVAQKAIDAGATNATWLTSTYIQPVVDAGTTYTYSVEYYFGDQTGEYVLDESKTVNSYAVLGTTVTATTNEVAGYTLNTEKSVTSGTVVALNGGLTLKCYYDQKALTIVNKEELALIEVNENPTLDLVSDYGYDISDYTVTAVLTAPNGRVITSTTPNAIATAEIPQGVYNVELKADDTIVYTTTVDIYNSADGMVWQEVSEYSVNDSEILRGGYIKLADTYVSVVDKYDVISFAMVEEKGSTTEVGMRLRAIHSKEYYEYMSNYFSAITFYVYVSGNSGLNIEVWEDTNNDGTNNDTDGIWQDKNSWAKYSVDINYLLENWVAINGVGKLHLGNVMQSQLFTTLYGYIDDNIVSIGRFSCKSITTTDATIVEEVQLIEQDTISVVDLTSYDTESKLDMSLPYTTTLVAQNGRIIYVDDPTQIFTEDIPQGLYTADIKYQGRSVLRVFLDFYRESDGMVWQVISKYSVNDSEILEYDDKVLEGTVYNEVNGVKTLSFVARNKTSGNGTGVGMRVRAIHSKEYYIMMSEYYEAITFDIYIKSAGGNVNVYYDGDGDGTDDVGTKWQGANKWVTYTMSISYLIENWDTMCTLGAVGHGDTLKNQIFTTQSATIGKSVFNIGNFGCVAKTAE